MGKVTRRWVDDGEQPGGEREQERGSGQIERAGVRG